MKIIKFKKEASHDDMLQKFHSNINNIIEYAQELKSMNIDNLEGWVMDKMSTINDDISEIKHFYSDSDKEEVESSKGLWHNVHKKRERGEPAAKPGDEDYPSKKTWEENTKESSYDDAVLKGIQADVEKDGLIVEAAEYQGKEVELNKPMRGDVKKFKVYVKNDKGNVVKVNFGDKNMEIKRDDPERRKNFRARHNCSNPGPKWKARYWSCKMWSSKSVSDILKD